MALLLDSELFLRHAELAILSALTHEFFESETSSSRLARTGKVEVAQLRRVKVVTESLRLSASKARHLTLRQFLLLGLAFREMVFVQSTWASSRCWRTQGRIQK